MDYPSRLSPALRATTVGFLLLGIFGGCFVAVIPRLQVQFHIAPGLLGVLLLMSPVGSLLVMASMPMLLQRVAHHHLVRWVLFILPVSLLVLAFANQLWLIAVSIGLIGVSNALVGIALNTYGVDIEHIVRRHIISRLHAANSMGTLVGAALAGVLLQVTSNRWVSVVVIAGVVLVVHSMVVRGFAELARPRRRSAAPLFSLVDTGWTPLFFLAAGSLLLIQLAEGATSDWSGVFMTQYHHAGPLLASAAYIGFTASMTLVRIFGARIIGLIGRWRSVLASVGMAHVGLLIGLLVPSPIATMSGFVILGLGVGLLVPMLISGAGVAGGEQRDQFIAQISVFGVIGQMTGPALIGLLATYWTLKFALFVPALALVLAVICIMIIRRNRHKIKHGIATLSPR